jgi:hypothetical protein
LSSVIFFFLYLSCFSPDYYANSFSYHAFRNIAPGIYLASFKFYNKFSPNAKLNTEVKSYYEAKKSLPGSDQKGN